EIKYGPFFAYLIANPSWISFGYLACIILMIFAIYIVTDTIFYVRKTRELQLFFLPTKEKVLQFAVIVLPFIYFYGKFAKFIINKNYYVTINAATQIAIAFIGIAFLYFIVCLLNYMAAKNKVKFTRKGKNNKL